MTNVQMAAIAGDRTPKSTEGNRLDEHMPNQDMRSLLDL